MERDCVQCDKSVVLNDTFQRSTEKAQEMREGRKGWKGGERDRRDREKNRLTSLHLIGSGCDHEKKPDR